MKKTLASAALVFGLLGQAGHAENFPQAALSWAPAAHSVNRAPLEAQALRVGFPTLAPVGRAAAGANRPPREVQASSIEFPGVMATPLRTHAEPVEAAATERSRLQTNRFQAISLR
ncbi:MAG: hypothetical protein ACRYGC_12170 [Janthinobacterium lividum]